MAYDRTAFFIEKLTDDIKRQADADFERERVKLSLELYATANDLYLARDKMNLAWNICNLYLDE